MSDEERHRHDHEHGRHGDHDHAHGGGHGHAPASFGRAFVLGVALNLGFVIVDAIFGISSHSV
ncbi:MAG TPA: cation transporter, partial [Roseiarcus sp.]|nr:cation transporter [Roseiarcus sp.]